MRILYSHRTKSADGQRVHIDALTRALRDEGHEVLICGPEGLSSPDAPMQLASSPQAGGASLLPGPLYELAEWAYSVPATRRLRAAAKSFVPDIIYERYNLYFHAGSTVAREREIPFLLEVNSPLVAERSATGKLALPALGRRAERQIWTSADAVLPVTAVLGATLAEAGVDPMRIHVVPNGVEEDALTPLEGTAVRTRYGLADKLVLGFTGFVRDWHRVDLVLDWLAGADGKNAHLLLVGDGPDTERLRQHASDMNVSDRFTITGVVQRSDVAMHVAAFDIALQPAVTPYASPLKLQEYMAQARAILAPDQPNIREVVTDGETALLTPPGDKDALFQALSRLRQSRELREKLGQAARQALLDRNMTWRGNARRVVEIAEGLLNRSS